MSENPYESPASDAEVPKALGVLSGSRADLRSVATYQKAIQICILIYFVVAYCQFALPPELRPLLFLGIIASGITGMVFVFLLATKVYGTGLGAVLGILTLIPCIGLIPLMIVNGKATNVLRQNGIRVGLMGANVSKI